MNKFFGALAILLSVLLVAFFILMLGTKFFSYDGVQQEWDISERIKIQKIENYGYDLDFQLSEGLSTPILSDCSVVYFDSLNNRIFAVEKLNEYDSNFHEIQIIDATNLDVSKISSEKFHHSIN